MQLAKPQVHLRKNQATSTYYIHVITWMDNSRFKANGYDTLSTNSTDGVFTVNLRIAEDSDLPDMDLLTPVVHTLELTGIALNTDAPFLDVKVLHASTNNVLGRRKTHKDDADDSGMPTP